MTTGLGNGSGWRSASTAAARTAKLGLRNSDGCKANSAEIQSSACAPSTSAPTNSTRNEPIRAQAKRDRRQRCLIWRKRQQRHAAQDADGDDGKRDLARGIAEIARRQRTAGDGGAGGEGQHQADADQRQHAEQRHAVHRQPPIGKAASVGAVAS